MPLPVSPYEKLNHSIKTKQARRISAARLFLLLCWLIAVLLILIQAFPAISHFLPQKPPAEILHSNDSYIAPKPEKAEILLDINQASAADFDELPGIGPVYSQAIVDYRENVSPFFFIEDLMNVKGVGEKRLQSIRPYLIELWPNEILPH